MPPFPEPRFAYTVDVAAEVRRLRAHKRARGVPAKAPTALLVGSWNVANLGLQRRRAEDHRLIAELLSWYDVAAVQECKRDFGGLFDVLHYMNRPNGGRVSGPRARSADRYAVLMSDASGNDERLAFVYDRRKLTLLEEVGEVALPPAQARRLRLPGAPAGAARFDGFDRTPFFASFALGGPATGGSRTGSATSVLLCNVHLYFGSDAAADRDRRALETTAVARWAAARRRSPFAFGRELVALGDFNLPTPDRLGRPGVYEALRRVGLELPAHSSLVASSVATDNRYDQVALFPETTRRCLVRAGVFDYDAVVFPDLWRAVAPADFTGYLRYYLSDHRPVWFELRPLPE